MASTLSTGARWLVWMGLAAALGIVAAVFLEQRTPLEQRVLGRAPKDASIVAYAELDPIRRSDVLGPILRQHLQRAAGLSLVEPDIDAVAVVVGSRELVGLAAGRFPLALVRRYLEENGGICAGALDEKACSMPAGPRGGYLSIRALDGGLLGVVNGPRPDAADSLATLSAVDSRLALEAREALDGGALVWLSIDPRRLADVMSDPPEGWINLSLVARALLSAEKASLDLRDKDGEQAVQATLAATCASEADAVEIAKMLESLNKLAATALRSDSSEDNQAWAQALETGFSSSADKKDVTVRWLLPANLLQRWN